MTSEPAHTSRTGMVAYLSAAAFTLMRRVGGISLLALVFCGPILGATYWVINRHVRLVSLSDVLVVARDTPTEALGNVLVTFDGARQSVLVLLAVVIASSTLSLPAVTLLTGAHDHGQVLPWYVCLWRSVLRLHRTIPAFMLSALVILLPVVSTAWVLRQQLSAGVRTWQDPAWQVLLTFSASSVLALWVGIRLAYVVPAAMTAPRRSLTLRAAAAGTRRAWWRTAAHIAVPVLCASGLSGAAASGLMSYLSYGTPTQVTFSVLAILAVALAGVVGVLGCLGVSWARTDTGARELESLLVRDPRHAANGSESRDLKASRVEHRIDAVAADQQ